MPWYVAAFELLLQVSLAGLVLLAVAWIVTLAVHEPVRRIRVIQLAFAGLVALPLVVLVPGYPRIALLPAPAERSTREEVEQAGAAMPSERLAPVAEVPAELEPPVALEDNSPQPEAPRNVAAETVTVPQSASAAASSRRYAIPRDYRFALVAIYLAGVAALLAWSLVSLVAIRRLVASSRPAGAKLRELLGEVAGPPGERVRLLVAPRAVQPCAFGLLRPTIVLPERLLAEQDQRQVQFALAHEWSHVARGDLSTWSLATIVRTLHFYNPLVWLLRSQLRLSQDYLADAAAAGTATPEDYAEFLTAISRRPGPARLMPGLGIAGRRSTLHRRVVMLVEKQGSLERAVPRRWNRIAITGALVAVAAVATLRAEPRLEEKSAIADPQPETQTTPGRPAAADRPNAQPYLDNLRETAAKESQLNVLIEFRERLVHLAEDSDPAIRTAIERAIADLDAVFMVRDRALGTARTISHPPFSGRIRPGDILDIEIQGGFPSAQVPLRTVEPEGTIALTAVYGTQRFHVAGNTLSEAGKLIEDKLREILRDPAVLVTYAGHDPDVVAAERALPIMAKPVEAKPDEHPKPAARRKLQPGMPTPALAPDVDSPDRIERLEREINELKEMIRELKAPAAQQQPVPPLIDSPEDLPKLKPE